MAVDIAQWLVSQSSREGLLLAFFRSFDALSPTSA